MRKILLIVIGLLGVLFAEQVPPGVQKVIDESLTPSGFIGDLLTKEAKLKVGVGFDSSTQLSDLSIGDPVMIYFINPDSSGKLDETLPLKMLITPPKIAAWHVPIAVNGRYRVILDVVKQDGQWAIGGVGRSFAKEWQKVINAWPKASGYHPRIVNCPSPHSGQPPRRLLFQVPEKGDSNLTWFSSGPHDDPSSAIVDTTFRTLTASRDMLKYLKDHSPVAKGGAR
jgi:hypothetical protein